MFRSSVWIGLLWQFIHGPHTRIPIHLELFAHAMDSEHITKKIETIKPNKSLAGPDEQTIILNANNEITNHIRS